MKNFLTQTEWVVLNRGLLTMWKNTPIAVENPILESWKDYKSYQNLPAIDNWEPLEVSKKYGVLGYDYYALRAKTQDEEITHWDVLWIRAQNKMFRNLMKIWLLSNDCYLRKSLLEDIWRTNEQLKSLGIQLVIMSGYRAPLVQLFAREAYELIHGEEKAMSMFWSPRTGPHCSWGGCDIELANLKGELLKTKFDLPDSMGLLFWEKLLSEGKHWDSKMIDVVQNRRLLYYIMRSMGFFPHVAEYWHYGRWDRLGTYLENTISGKQQPARYNTVLPKKEQALALSGLVRERMKNVFH